MSTEGRRPGLAMAKSAKSRRKRKPKRIHSHCIHVQDLAEIGQAIHDRWPGLIGISMRNGKKLSDLAIMLIQLARIDEEAIIGRLRKEQTNGDV